MQPTLGATQNTKLLVTSFFFGRTAFRSSAVQPPFDINFRSGLPEEIKLFHFRYRVQPTYGALEY